VRNGRGSGGRLSLDREGFVLARQPTPFTRFYDADAVKAEYYPECERSVRRLAGAARVVVFDHNVRHAPKFQLRESGAKEPVKRAHNDYTVTSGPQRVRDLLGGEAEALLERRFAIINLWRPIHGPVEDAARGTAGRAAALARLRPGPVQAAGCAVAGAVAAAKCFSSDLISNGRRSG